MELPGYNSAGWLKPDVVQKGDVNLYPLAYKLEQVTGSSGFSVGYYLRHICCECCDKIVTSKVVLDVPNWETQVLATASWDSTGGIKTSSASGFVMIKIVEFKFLLFLYDSRITYIIANNSWQQQVGKHPRQG